jgi:eukaryotic-like serine/threonine-protein kinase
MTQARLVGGRYELGELIGYGGMAEVHRGRDVRLGREVAIKVLRADLARDPSFLNRFRREAQSAAGLNHPSIVAVYDTGQDTAPDGTSQPYIVMEYVEGRTLRDIIKTEGRLPARRAMDIAADVAGALDFSHKNGLIHRDVKPANVMITEAGAVKVMDFGIARAVADNGATVTQTANVIGTAQYLSPEQARGETVDPRSDVYSLGCLLYELVTGVPPFQGDSPVAVAYQHVRENATAPTTRVPDLPRALDSIIMKALAKNQLNRYQTAGEMRTDLQRALANQPVSAEAVMTDAERTQFIARTPPPPVAVPRRPAGPPPEPEDERRTGLIWVAIIVALLLVIGIGVILFLKLGGEKGPPAAKQVAVPSVIGIPVDDAIVKFKNADLTLAPSPDGDSTNGPCDDGKTPDSDSTKVVCKLTRTDNGEQVKVSADDMVDEKSTVYYQYFEKERVNVPSVLGEQYSDAAATLGKLGLKIKAEKVNSTAPENQVVGQKPSVNSSVTPGTVITLQVSSGTIKLPDVHGKTFNDAREVLNHAGFPVVHAASTTTSTTDQSKNGLVADEDPTPGNAYKPSTTITLTLYKYEPPPPTCTTPPPPPTPPITTGPSSGPSVSSGGLPPCTSTTP